MTLLTWTVVHVNCESTTTMSSNLKVPAITIPDLRFEQSFLKSLDRYADQAQSKKSAISNAELKLLDIDDDKSVTNEAELAPIAPITPGIVMYAILKDQIFMPLLQGFLWSGLLLCVRPFLGMIVANGQRWGTWVANGIGISPRRVRR